MVSILRAKTGRFAKKPTVARWARTSSKVWKRPLSLNLVNYGSEVIEVS